MKTTTAWFLGLAVTAFLAQGARSDVTDMRENSFSIESKVTTRAAAAVVYRELGRLSRWWDSEHTYSGSAKNLSLQMQAGGCFCETTSNGGSIQHGRVIYAQPNESLRLDAFLAQWLLGQGDALHRDPRVRRVLRLMPWPGASLLSRHEEGVGAGVLIAKLLDPSAAAWVVLGGTDAAAAL